MGLSMGCCDLRSGDYPFQKMFEGFLRHACHEALHCCYMPEIPQHHLGGEKLWPRGRNTLIYRDHPVFFVSPLVLGVLELVLNRVIVRGFLCCCESRCVQDWLQGSQTVAIFLAVGSAPPAFLYPKGTGSKLKSRFS